MNNVDKIILFIIWVLIMIVLAYDTMIGLISRTVFTFILGVSIGCFLARLGRK